MFQGLAPHGLEGTKMLNGIAPIFIFHFKKKVTVAANKETPGPAVETYVDLPPIPVYLDARLTGIQVDSTSKNLDIKTTTIKKASGTVGGEDQTGLGSTVTLNLVSNKDSIGATIILALLDLAFDKLESAEYAVTLLYGSVTLFFAKIDGVAVAEESDNNRRKITIRLTKGIEKTVIKPPIAVTDVTTGPAPVTD